MVIKNKKNGSNILAYKNGGIVTRVEIGAGQQISIPGLSNFSQVVNKGDFETGRGWFEIVNENNSTVVEEKKVKEKNETTLEKAKKEVIEYTSEKKKK